MAKRPLDHDRPREGEAAREYARVEREQADPLTDPKVKVMTKGARKDESKSALSRLKRFLKIDRKKPES